MFNVMGVIKFLIKLVWELPSNLLALILIPFLGVDKFDFDWKNGIVIVTMSYAGAMTLGCFIFVRKEDWYLLEHEYGHIRQGWVLGPLYLLVIGLPSIIWCMIYKYTGKEYEWFYTEHWLMKKKEEKEE